MSNPNQNGPVFKTIGNLIILIAFQSFSFFITFHTLKAFKKIDPNLPFFQKITEMFKIIFSKEGVFNYHSKLNIIFGLLSFISFLIIQFVFSRSVNCEEKLKNNEKNSKTLQYFIFSSLPFLLIIPIGFYEKDFRKYGLVLLFLFYVSKIFLENLTNNKYELLTSYEKIDEIQNKCNGTEKLQAIFFEVILCFPSFAIEFLIETISKGIGKGTGFVIDGISKVCCGKKAAAPSPA